MVFVPDGLITCSRIDNTQSPHPEENFATTPGTPLIWTAVLQSVRCSLCDGGIDLANAYATVNSAHTIALVYSSYVICFANSAGAFILARSNIPPDLSTKVR